MIQKIIKNNFIDMLINYYMILIINLYQSLDRIF